MCILQRFLMSKEVFAVAGMLAGRFLISPRVAGTACYGRPFDGFDYGGDMLGDTEAMRAFVNGL